MSLAFADLVILNFKIHSANFSLSVGQILIWIIALIIGMLARLAFGRRIPFGIIGTVLMALIGIWFVTDVFLINIPRDLIFYDVPLLKAVIGAIFFELLWYLISYRSYRAWERRRRRHGLASLPPTQKQ